MNDRDRAPDHWPLRLNILIERSIQFPGAGHVHHLLSGWLIGESGPAITRPTIAWTPHGSYGNPSGLDVEGTVSSMWARILASSFNRLDVRDVYARWAYSAPFVFQVWVTGDELRCGEPTLLTQVIRSRDKVAGAFARFSFAVTTPPGVTKGECQLCQDMLRAKVLDV